MRSALNAAERATNQLNTRLGDSAARLQDWAVKVIASGKASEVFNRNNLELASSISNIITGARNAVGSIESLGRSAFNAAEGILSLFKSASDFGSVIHDARDQTGLSAEALSTLQFAAANSGKSFEQVTAGISRFSKIVGDAADGSDKATAKLTKFGLDPQAAIGDLDGTLNKVFATIAKLPPGIEQVAAAQTLFGRSGADLIPIIKQMGGEFDKNIETARKLGITLSEQDVKAADDFGDSLGLLGTQAKVAGSKFLLDLMPDVTRALDSISKALSENRGQIAKYADGLRYEFEGIQHVMRTTDQVSKSLSVAFGVNLPASFSKFITVITTIGPPILLINKYLTLLVETAGRWLTLQGRMNNGTVPRGSAGLSGVLGNTGGAGATIGAGFNFKPGKKSFFGDEGDDADSTAGKVSKLNKALKEHNDQLKEISKSWTSSSLAEFARSMGFTPGSGAGAAGHNVGSLHAVGKALDIGLNTNQRSVDQIVDLMVKSIQAGIRVVDERIRPPGQKVFGGPNIHLEENDKRPSFFNPKLNYGGQLELLKALDAERIAGSGKSIANTLLSLRNEALKTKEQGIDLLAEGTRKLEEIFDKLTETPVEAALRKVNDQLSDKSVVAALSQYDEQLQNILIHFARLAAIDKVDVSIGSGRPDSPDGGGLGLGEVAKQGTEEFKLAVEDNLPPPPSVIVGWDKFWLRMQQNVDIFKASLPSINQVMGESLMGALTDIGDVFGNAIQRWDGTLKGFFSSVAAGFTQMTMSIISDIIRILVYKAILAIIGAFAGGGGSLPGGGDAGAFSQVAGLGRGNGVFGLAEGGLVRGPGTSTSDSILARLSNREFVMSSKAVKYWGSGLMEQLNSLKMPGFAVGGMNYAGSGYSSGMSNQIWENGRMHAGEPTVSTVNIHNHYHANRNGAFSPRSAESVARDNASAIERVQTRRR